MRDALGPPPVARRHLDSLFLQLLCLYAGLGLAVAPEQPGALERTLPAWLTTAWAGFLILGATAVIAGEFWRGQTTGLLLEFAGRVTLVIGSTIYAGAFLAVSGGLTTIDVLPLLVFDVFCVLRARQVLHPIREAQGVLAIMRRARDQRDEP